MNIFIVVAIVTSILSGDKSVVVRNTEFPTMEVCQAAVPESVMQLSAMFATVAGGVTLSVGCMTKQQLIQLESVGA